MKIAQIVEKTEAEGPGKRFAIWFQGCPFRCPECCNPEMLSFDKGVDTPQEEIINKLKSQIDIEGITLLGGEPFAHVQDGFTLSKVAHEIGLNVMVFSGYLYEDILKKEEFSDFIKEIDILVDGFYMKDLPETKRRWIGSSNQRIFHLSNRTDPNDPRWLQKNTLEIRLNRQELTVNGFPAKHAKDFWKRK